MGQSVKSKVVQSLTCQTLAKQKSRAFRHAFGRQANVSEPTLNVVI